MKIRTGFVSNSSSSSFVCMGVRFKAKDCKFYDEDDRDRFHEVMDDEGSYYDSEGEGGWVYHGLYFLQDDEEWSFERVEEFDKIYEQGLGDYRERMTRKVREVYKLPEKAKIEFGMWAGRVAS